MVVYNGVVYIDSVCAYCGKLVTRKKQSSSANVKLHFCNNKCKSLYQKLAKPVTREWLEDKYINKGLDTSQIGILVNRNPKSVWNWLKDFGIQTRGRGYASEKYAFKKGENWWLGKTHPPEFSEKLRQIRLKDGHFPKQDNGLPYWTNKRSNNWQGGITPERQKLYDSDEWKELVIEVWKRDNGICQRCGLDNRIVNREIIKFAIHHIITFRHKEFRLVLDNLILLCLACHRFVHSKANADKEFRG